MAMVPAGEVQVRGVRFKVLVSDDDGKFFANIPGGSQVSADSRKRLIEQIAKHTRKPISVPVMRWNEEAQRMDRGVITGRHAGNEHFLIKWGSDRSAEQFQRWESSELMQLTDEQAKRYVELQKAATAAIAAVEKFEEDHETNVEAIVRVELEKQS